MKVGGLVKFSLNDYPSKSSAVVFTLGCNFRCTYCHNPELVLPEQYAKEIPEAEIFDFLQSRVGKLDAVVISGGEPTQHADLLEFFKKIKEMGFLTKLDTNGTRPLIIKNLIDQKLLDYIAMDIKAPLKSEKYKEIVKVPIDIDAIENSISIIINSQLSHEFRTTIVKSLTTFDDIREIVKEIKGAQNYFLQKFVSAGKLLDESFSNEISYSHEELNSLATELSSSFNIQNCSVR